MSTDNRDKTVFRQPTGNPDRTVIRPAPGGRGAARAEPAKIDAPSPPPAPPLTPPQAQPSQPAYQPQQPQPVQPQANVQFQPNMEPQTTGQAYFETRSGLNPIVNAASTLIAVFEKTHQSMSHTDVGGLHQGLTNEIRLFENKLKELGVKPEVVLSARYCVCTAMDEAVLNTPWGTESGWSQRSLLSVFHNETAGGEKFFLILDRMREYPAENIDLLELLYLFLSLGFEGKYRVINRGRDMIEQLRDELYNIIRRQRGEFERSLSPNWRGLGNTRNSLTSYIPFWVVASVLAAVLFLSYSGFRVWMLESSTPVIAKLEEISNK